MSKWIDAEYCESFFDRWESRVKNADPVTIDVVQNTRTLLRDAPSIDIVHCNDCIRFDGEDCCERIGMILYPEDVERHFCGYGERKDNE